MENMLFFFFKINIKDFSMEDMEIIWKTYGRYVFVF